MPARYTQAVDTAITALLAARTPTLEILERLNQGTAADELPAIDPPMPRRTFFDHVRKIRADNPDLEHDITPDNELERVGALRRRLLHLCEHEHEKLNARAQARKPLTPREIGSLTKLTKTVDDIHARASRREQLASSPSAPHRASAAAASTPRDSLMSRLRQSERRHRAE